MAYRYTRNDKLALGAHHVYNQARDGLWMFRDNDDRDYFQFLIDRHISAKPRFDQRGRPYVHLRDEVRMNARNLLYSHFHLVLWQRVPGGIERLMSRVLSRYSMHYNAKYGTSGYLYRCEYRARLIESPAQFRWRVGYVHDNHEKKGVAWKYSTHSQLIVPSEAASALDVDATLKLFGGVDGYLAYMAKRAQRKSLDRELRFESSLY